MNEPIKVIVPAEMKGQRLDKALVLLLEESRISRSKLSRLLDEGRVLMGEEQARARYKLKGGEALSVELPAVRSTEVKAAKIPLDILFEDKDLVVINKQAGLVTHPGAGHQDDTLVSALMHHCGKTLKPISGALRPGIVHRLDKDTTGCLVAAKSEAAFRGLQALIQAHDVTRLYLALVWGDLREDGGTIDAPLGRGPDRKKMALRPGGREAVTHFKVRARYGGQACELECKLETGRTHQIRAHLAGIKHPVICDPSYGRTPGHLAPVLGKALDGALKRQALHAWKLKFKHPITGKLIAVQAPEPDDYAQARKLLKAQVS